jgi:hypothetical protein
MQTIKEYTDKIVEGNFDTPECVCKKCGEKPEEYKLHECRKRQVRFSVGALVEILMTFLPRWKCSLCGATFTQYPPFIAPCKLFALAEIVRLSRKYLEDENATYADAVVEDGDEIGYPDRRGLCDSFVSRSTVWRFVQYLASLRLEETEPSMNDGLRTPRLPARKYRSEKRRQILHRAVEAVGQFAGFSFFRAFPDFETPLP